MAKEEGPTKPIADTATNNEGAILPLREFQKQRAAAKEIQYVPWHEDEALEGTATSFATSFVSTLPETYNYTDDPFCFSHYIIDTLEHGPDKPLAALEFGGPGSRLFERFPPGFFSKTIGICLKDNRELDQLPGDNKRNHAVLESDIFNIKTYQSIKKVLGDTPVGLIISRMQGALNFVTNNPILLGILLRQWYALLVEDGLMFIQYSPGLVALDNKKKRVVDEWIQTLQKQYSDEIEIQNGSSSFRLLKKKGAPSELPLLSV